jgi:CheY-like chemotaxis protein
MDLAAMDLASRPVIESRARNRAGEARRMSGEHLLVIDDSPTVLKVVEVALTKAGFRVATAGDGPAALALAREPGPTPALILLDCRMPGKGMDGYQCCQALAGDPRLAAVPVILMAAKGEDVEEKFSQAANVVDYITKPFSPEAIQAVVTHVIEKRSRPAGSVDPAGAAPHQEKATTPATKAAVAEALSRSTAQAAPGSGAGFTALREDLAQRLESYRQETGKWDLAELVQGALDDATLERLLSARATSSGPVDASAAAGPALSGDLAAISISEVLSLLHEQSQTGYLRALNNKARVELYFRGGKIDFAAAVGVAEEFLLGRFAIEAGDLTPDALTAVLDERARSPTKPGLFGADLVSRGLLSEDQLKQAMTRQTAELVYEVLRWGNGSFYFRRTAELPELARGAALAIPVDVLLLEGFRRVDEWRVIEREIESFDLVFVRNDTKIAEVPRGSFTRDEVAVLELVNGRHSVREIIRVLRLGSFDVSKILYRLLRTKLIRRLVMPAAA